ncbi:hypothetical protein XPR_2326 [Xanthomonas arboricola pv. pruni MAFF 301420]|uniref:Uncharacterized protein n=1 Tax=Xanthomonas arboricola pv. pruni MAFF 301420 TaxID=1418095 RepID=W4SGN3_9XANT|nr:hypothetical protein XPR_2326 [Xanthomonas arboricola pv. pruni MAFF 301420]
MTDDDTSCDDTAAPPAHEAVAPPPLFILGVGADGLDAARLAELLDAVTGAPNLVIMLLLRDRHLLDEPRLRELLGPQSSLLLRPRMAMRCIPGVFTCRPARPW